MVNNKVVLELLLLVCCYDQMNENASKKQNSAQMIQMKKCQWRDYFVERLREPTRDVKGQRLWQGAITMCWGHKGRKRCHWIAVRAGTMDKGPLVRICGHRGTQFLPELGCWNREGAGEKCFSLSSCLLISCWAHSLAELNQKAAAREPGWYSLPPGAQR